MIFALTVLKKDQGCKVTFEIVSQGVMMMMMMMIILYPQLNETKPFGRLEVDSNTIDYVHPNRSFGTNSIGVQPE